MSLLAWADRDDAAGALHRAVGHRRVTRPVRCPPAVVDDGDAALRERVLWRLLSDSGSTVTAVLALDVEHLDLDGRRAGPITWTPGTGVLLAALVAGRRRGPVFLSDRRPAPSRTPSPRDLCPDTGRRRLSYERAEYLFKQHTGVTLRRLRR